MVSGLACVHERQMVHGDLKPNNVGISYHGGDLLVKLLDFGRSKSVNASEWRHTDMP